MDVRFKIGLSLIVTALVYFWNDSGSNESIIARKWALLEGKQTNFSKIAVGLNANLDLIVNGPALLRALAAAPLAPAAPPEVLRSDEDLSRLLAHSMHACAGVERFFSDLERFREIVEIADRGGSFGREYYIGGNGALMAQKLTHLTPDSTRIHLGGPVGSKLRGLLGDRITTGSLHPLDEVHMILEYSGGEEWGSVKSSCANRIVFSNDVANSKMEGMDAFFAHIRSEEPDLIIFSGVHLLERYSRPEWRETIKRIKTHLEGVSPQLPLHWELASIGSMDLMEDIIPALLPRTPSLGLNEQELRSAVQASGGPSELLTPSETPKVGVVADSLYWLLSKYGNVDGRRPEFLLSRVHFHSLSFHIIAHISEAWSSSAVAVVRGTEIAGRQACDDDVIIPSKLLLKIPKLFFLSVQDRELSQTPHSFDPNSPQLSWKRGRVEFHFSPVLICKKPVKTVGLGDAISSTGLLYSQYYGPLVTGNV